MFVRWRAQISGKNQSERQRTAENSKIAETRKSQSVEHITRHQGADRPQKCIARVREAKCGAVLRNWNFASKLTVRDNT